MKYFLKLPNDVVEISIDEKLVGEAIKGGKKAFNKIEKRQSHPCKSCAIIAILDFFMNHDDYQEHSQYKEHVIALLYATKSMGKEVHLNTPSITVSVKEMSKTFGFAMGDEVEDVKTFMIRISYQGKYKDFELGDDINSIGRAFDYEYNSLDHPCIACMSRKMIDDFDNLEASTRRDAITLAQCAVIMEKLRLEDGIEGLDLPPSKIKHVDLEVIEEFADDLVNR